MKQQLSQTLKQVKEIQGELETAKGRHRSLRQLLARRDRYAELLRLLAHERVESLVIDTISSDAGRLQVSGRAIESGAASQLAMQISERAGVIGWNVQPPELSGENKTVSGGPWRFTINLVDSVPAEETVMHTTYAVTNNATVSNNATAGGE